MQNIQQPQQEEKVIHRSRAPLFEIQGYVIKQGEGWALIMERDTQTETVAIKQEIPGGAGATETAIYAYGPATALLCFKKGKFQPFPTETLFNFFVEVSAGLEQKTNKVKPKFWLTHADKLGPTPAEREEEKQNKLNCKKIITDKLAATENRLYDQALKILDEPEQVPTVKPSPARKVYKRPTITSNT